RAGDVKIGSEKVPLPLAGLATYFSPIGRIAPPPLGNSSFGAAGMLLARSRAGASASVLRPVMSGKLGRGGFCIWSSILRSRACNQTTKGHILQRGDVGG